MARHSDRRPAGKTATAIRASTHSRTNMTTSRATMVPTWRTAITSTVDDEAGEAVDVGDDAGPSAPPSARDVKKRQRHALDVRVQLAPDARDDALADRRPSGTDWPKRPMPLSDVRAEERERIELEHQHVALDEDVVHRGLDEPGDEALAPRTRPAASSVPSARHRPVRAGGTGDTGGLRVARSWIRSRPSAAHRSALASRRR